MKLNRNESIHFRVTQKEKNAVWLLATKEQMKPSELMRELIRVAIKGKGMDIAGIVLGAIGIVVWIIIIIAVTVFGLWALQVYA